MAPLRRSKDWPIKRLADQKTEGLSGTHWTRAFSALAKALDRFQQSPNEL
jgi:hypothetical protein